MSDCWHATTDHVSPPYAGGAGGVASHVSATPIAVPLQIEIRLVANTPKALRSLARCCTRSGLHRVNRDFIGTNPERVAQTRDNPQWHHATSTSNMELNGRKA